jgi:hypothetical protein
MRARRRLVATLAASAVTLVVACVAIDQPL